MSSYSSNPQVEKSLKHSVRDGVAFSVMTGTGETYFSAYAVFLKANAAQISLLAALPALLGSFAQWLSVWLGRRAGARKPIILAAASLQAVTWLPLMLLPLAAPDHAVTLLIAGVALYYTFVNLAAPLWNSLMGDLVPERRRGRFFARRTRLMSITSFVALIAAGSLLHLAEQYQRVYLGFVAIFTVAMLARFYSVYQLAQMHEPKGAIPSPVFPSTAGGWARMRQSHFVRFSSFFALMNFTVAVASPFFTLYMLRDLGFSYLEFTAVTAMSVIVQFLTLNTWGRLGDIFGNRLILATTAALIPLSPVLWLLSSNFWYILAIQILGGLAWAGFSLSASNFLYDVVSAEKRASYSAVHNILSSVAIFFGALLGGALSRVIPTTVQWGDYTLDWTSGLWGVFIASTILRAIIVLVFVPRLREVREVRPSSAGALLFRVLRYNALAGLVFEIMAPRRRPRAELRPAPGGGVSPQFRRE